MGNPLRPLLAVAALCVVAPARPAAANPIVCAELIATPASDDVDLQFRINVNCVENPEAAFTLVATRDGTLITPEWARSAVWEYVQFDGTDTAIAPGYHLYRVEVEGEPGLHAEASVGPPADAGPIDAPAPSDAAIDAGPDEQQGGGCSVGGGPGSGATGAATLLVLALVAFACRRRA